MSQANKDIVTSGFRLQKPRLDEDPRDILDLLGDDKARRILESTENPKTVSELVNELELAQSTAYRKVEELKKVGLIRQTNVHTTDQTSQHYRRSFQNLMIRFQEEFIIEA